MTDLRLQAVAERHGLTVEKTVTTGTELEGFATFRFIGDAPAIRLAWNELRPHARKGFDRLTATTNPDHPEYGRPFIECESIYFDHTDRPPVGSAAGKAVRS